MVNKIQEFSRLHDVLEPVFNNSDSVKKPTIQIQFFECHQVTITSFRGMLPVYHLLWKPLVRKTCRFSTIGLWKFEAQH